jgi:hypothetical protein
MMTKKHISMRGETYARLKGFCVLVGITAGRFVEKLCLHHLETGEDLTLEEAVAGGKKQREEPEPEEDEEPEEEPTPPPDHNYGLPRKDKPPKSKPNPPRGGGVHFF